MSDLVQTFGLTKRYGGRTVVDNLELRIPAGVIYGFLGPNGSGKSTTMKMILSLVQPSEGQALINDKPMNRDTRREHLARIGSLIESPPGYGHLTGAQNMKIVQRMLDIPDAQIEWAISVVRLDNQMDKRVREYSLGMKQRLGIAMALARKPSLLILDEPTNGLDPAGIEEIRRLLLFLVDNDVTVMVSSHLLEEIDRTATMFGVLAHGRLLFQGSRTELMRASSPDTILDCSDPRTAIDILVHRGADGVYEHGALRIPGLTREMTANLVSALVDQGISVYEVRQKEQTLEDVFMDLTRSEGL